MTAPFMKLVLLSLEAFSALLVAGAPLPGVGAAETCPLEPGCGELLVQAAVKALHQLKP